MLIYCRQRRHRLKQPSPQHARGKAGTGGGGVSEAAQRPEEAERLMYAAPPGGVVGAQAATRVGRLDPPCHVQLSQVSTHTLATSTHLGLSQASTKTLGGSSASTRHSSPLQPNSSPSPQSGLPTGLSDHLYMRPDAAPSGHTPTQDKPTIQRENLQTAEGLEFLSGRRHIHRDVAARNCLVTSSLQVKLAAPALTRDAYSSEYHTYRNQEECGVLITSLGHGQAVKARRGLVGSEGQPRNAVNKAAKPTGEDLLRRGEDGQGRGGEHRQGKNSRSKRRKGIKGRSSIASTNRHSRPSPSMFTARVVRISDAVFEMQ
ncbi:Tyrosine-protein kinase transmembrane receptor Ror [Portunus trituberculatus]|uniref:Tyrosine-protein kinase transmembrane receptor Ror n=1 Tax=Portunus trituberculatus TaxID=210409 RepID=A0A5B7EP93_PORTR|nr:Tyrosine-protein kinase transmembrane receptor Ror [Portunus trituberculatus]